MVAWCRCTLLDGPIKVEVVGGREWKRLRERSAEKGFEESRAQAHAST